MAPEEKPTSAVAVAASFASRRHLVRRFLGEGGEKRIFAGVGFMHGCPASRSYRDIQAATIADGMTEIQRCIVAREIRRCA